ncbi:MAG: hypothetical protein FJ214_02315 [Ignavibacteria bacterium]|nr:hypothetical protein [Ignavibacteria bacterium]
MKAKTLIFLIITATLLYAGAELVSFTARSQGGNVVLNWQTQSETNLKNFVVERKTINGGFIEVGTLDPRSDKNYQYVDQSAFKSSDVLYIYRLKIVDTDGTISYSWEVAVPHNVSSVKRTWGSIKALFR